MSFSFDVLDVGRLGFQFDEPDMQALTGLRLDSGPLRSARVYGFSMGLGGRYLGILRMPELRLSVGGGSIDGPFCTPEGAPQGLQTRIDSVVALRVELAAGIQIPIHRFRPFVTGRVGYAGYFVNTSVRDDRLGNLGEERVRTGAWEVATDVGLAILAIESIELSVAWRHTWVGARGNGLLMTLSIGTDSL